MSVPSADVLNQLGSDQLIIAERANVVLCAIDMPALDFYQTCWFFAVYNDETHVYEAQPQFIDPIFVPAVLTAYGLTEWLAQ